MEQYEQYEALLRQANTRISILERQRNDAMNQTLNAMTELHFAIEELDKTRERANILAARCGELSEQINTQAEELDRLTAARLRKRKTDG